MCALIWFSSTKGKERFISIEESILKKCRKESKMRQIIHEEVNNSKVRLKSSLSLSL